MKHFLIMATLAACLISGCGSGAPIGEVPSAQGHQILVGLQLYSVRTELQKDFYGTLKKVRDMGYTGVEFYSEWYGHSMAEVKRMCTELGLVPFANHVPFQLMMDDLDKVIEDNTVLGVQYIVFPYMDNASRPGVDPVKFKETVARIAEVGPKVKEAGFQLLYHNHDFEFAELPDGTPGHDYIFSTSSPQDLQVELDACWADYTGRKADDLIRMYSGRIPVVHAKDYYLEGKLSNDPYALIGVEGQGGGDQAGKFEFRPLGKGVMDIPAMIQACRESGVIWLCVEQDEPSAGAADRFEGPAESIAYLRDAGIL